MSARGPKSDKLWSDAVRVAALREAELDGKKTNRLNVIANNLVLAAMAGDKDAIAELGNRIDGKPRQATEVTGEGGGPLLFSWLKE